MGYGQDTAGDRQDHKEAIGDYREGQQEDAGNAQDQSNNDHPESREHKHLTDEADYK